MPSDTSQALAELAEGIAYEWEEDPERVRRILKASAVLAGLAVVIYVFAKVLGD